VAKKLEEEFKAAVETVRSAPETGAFKPSNEFKLKMYALYRQAKDGDVQGKRPGMLDPVGRFKWDAWSSVKGMSRDEAMKQYVEEVRKIEKAYG
jgi:diazepam-binding inhibitor (GABA receptor modulating acyl-CoA-binding protein)